MRTQPAERNSTQIILITASVIDEVSEISYFTTGVKQMFFSSFIQVCPASWAMVTEGQHTRKVFSQLMSTIKIHTHNLGTMFQYEIKM